MFRDGQKHEMLKGIHIFPGGASRRRDSVNHSTLPLCFSRRHATCAIQITPILRACPYVFNLTVRITMTGLAYGSPLVRMPECRTQKVWGLSANS